MEYFFDLELVITDFHKFFSHQHKNLKYTRKTFFIDNFIPIPIFITKFQNIVLFIYIIYPMIPTIFNSFFNV